MDPDQNALVRGLMGNLNSGGGASPQALAQALFGSFGGSGSYRDPQQATPQMIQNQLTYGEGLMNGPKEIHRPWEGINEMVRALLGGSAIHDANAAQQSAIAGAGHDYAEAQREGQNAGVGGGVGTSAGAASGAPVDTSPGFNSAVNRTLGFEGGLNPRDTNGTPSNYGINQAANPDVNVSNLTPQTAKALYKQRYWDAIGADNMPPALARVAFDTAVIAGPGKASDLVAQSGGDPNKLLALRQTYQNGLIQSDPAKYEKDVGAWANRNQALASDVSAMTSGGAGAPSPGGGATPGGFTHPVAQALANYRPGIDPELAGRITSSPWSSAEAKMYVQGLINPQVLKDGFGNQYYVPPGGRAGQIPGMGPGVLPGSVGTPGATVPTVTTATSGPNPTVRTQPLVPNSGTGVDPRHPLAGIAPVVHDAQQLNAEGTQTQAQASDDVSKINAYSADGVRAKGALAQLNAIDAAALKAPSGVPGKLQEMLGRYGVDAGGLGPLETYQSAIDAFAPNNPVAGQFKAALGSMLATPEGRQAAVANMKLLAQYQQQIGDIANDRSIPYSARMQRIQALPPPSLSLPGQAGGTAGDPARAAPAPAAAPSPVTADNSPHAGTFSSADDALAQARAAIASGRPRSAVESRLRQVGIDPGKL